MSNFDKYRLAEKVIKKYEGFSSNIYKCPNGTPTIGFGRTYNLKPNEITTIEAESKYLFEEMLKINRVINRLVKPRMSHEKMACLISFVYNIGEGAFAKSTFLKRINEGDRDAHYELFRWVTVNGRALKGLYLRREEEFKLYDR